MKKILIIMFSLLLITVLLNGCDNPVKKVGITIKAQHDAGYSYSNVRIDNIILGDSLPVDTVVKRGTHTISWTYDYLGLLEPETYSKTINIKQDGEIYELQQNNLIKK